VNIAPYLIPALSVVVAFAAFYFATRAARATASGAVHAVDAEAYTRASAIYEDTITNLRTDILGLRSDISAARAEIRDLRQSNEAMALEIRKMNATIRNGGSGPFPKQGKEEE
jgi:hypothetical protein